MLLTGGQIHLVLVVIHADVDNVGQQLLVAWDHFQLLVETLNSSAPTLVSPCPASSSPTAPRMAHCWALGQCTALPTTSGGGEPATSPQCLQWLVRAAAHHRGQGLAP